MFFCLLFAYFAYKVFLLTTNAIHWICSWLMQNLQKLIKLFTVTEKQASQKKHHQSQQKPTKKYIKWNHQVGPLYFDKSLHAILYMFLCLKKFQDNCFVLWWKKKYMFIICHTVCFCIFFYPTHVGTDPLSGLSCYCRYSVSYVGRSITFYCFLCHSIIVYESILQL